MNKKLSREVWIGWISSSVEAYNMAIYSFMAPLLAPFLFSFSDTPTALFLTYSLALIGSCFFYPLGALVYGLIGDKYGRQKTCLYSTLGLGVSTGLMGLVPFQGFENIAWVCFLLLICSQYFFSGGEYQGSIIFALEHSAKAPSGLMSALSSLFAVGGLAVANGLASLSYVLENKTAVRGCFLLGLAGGAVSYFLKNNCRETPVFATLPQESLNEVNWLQWIKFEWQTVVLTTSVMAFFIVSYSFIFVFLPLTDRAAYEELSTLKSLAAYGFFLVAAGWAADRFGMQKILTAGLVSFSTIIVPLCYLSENLLVVQITLTGCACLVIGPVHGWMLRQFPPASRCRGIFLSSAITMSLFLGSSVPICLMIYEKFHSVVACSFYPLAVALVALAGLMRSAERNRINDDQPFRRLTETKMDFS